MNTKSLFKKAVNLATLASFLLWNLAAAVPTGGSVAQGSAAISQSGATTTVNQTSQNAVINWHSFDTASNEAVKFNQPNASSIALNRITSGTPTSFAGQLTANGQVWILNPAGVLFTSTSRVDVGGLVASTLNMTDSNFMNKNYKLEQMPGASQGSVINNGLITSHENGLVALVAPTVENNGTIVANMGNVLLASGTVATLDPYGDNLINFAPNNYAVEGSVTNNGNISTNGGKVVMAANSVNKIIKNVVNNGGIIEARNIAQGADGVIVLGGNSGTTNIGGRITSNKIVIKGHDTKISGVLQAQDVGSIETSGEKVSIDASAVIDAGKGGLWYLDPLTINISDYNGLVQSQLQAGTNVTLSTGTNLSVAGTGDINVDQAISWNSSATLLLAAYRNINVSQPFSSNGGSVVMRADTANNKAGNVIFSGAAAGAGANVMNGGGISIYYNPVAYSSPTNYAAYFSGSSSVVGLMMINNATDLANAGAAGSSSTLFSYALTNDINYFNSVFGVNSTFNGIFDGYDYATGLTHTISGFNMFVGGSNNNIGAIAGINNGTIRNLNIISNGIIGNDQSDVGGIVGQNNGTISNVYFSGDVISITNSFVGGIAGYNHGLISHVTVNNQGIVGTSTNNDAGGIAGHNDGVIQYAGVLAGGGTTSSVQGRTGGIVGTNFGSGSSCGSGGSICNSYNLAPVSGSGTVGTFLAPTGGIVGSNNGNTAIKFVYNTGAVTANGSASSNVGPILGDVPGGGGALFIAGWYYYLPTCSSCSTLWGSTSLFTIPNLTAQASYQQGSVGDRFDFVNIWTTNGNTTVPNIKPIVLPVINTVLGEGALSVPSAQNISVYENGVLQGTSSSDANGVYGFAYNPNTFGTSTFLVTTNGSVKGATLEKINVAGPNPITGLDITSGLVTVDNVVGIGTFSNTDLAFASGGPTTPYSASGNNITLNAGVGFLTTAITPYNLNGNINAPGTSGITFNDTVSLGANSILTSGGNIDFASTVDGGNALTANAAGVVTFGDNVGGSAPLGSLTVSSNGAITEAGFIKVTGGSSFSAGANAIDLSNAANSFGGIITLSNSGAGNDVTVVNSIGTSLGATSVGGVFTLTSLSGITLNGNVTSGDSQTYHGPMLLNGNYTLTANTGNIDFDGTINGGDFFAVSAPAGSVTFGDNVGGTAFILGLTVSAGGPIVEDGFIHVQSGSTFTSSSSYIDLSQAGNVFIGAISLNTTGNNDATLVHSIGTVLGTSSVGGILSVTSNGPIIQTGPLTVGGASNFSAGANAIDLSNANNSFSGVITLSNSGAGNNVTVVNTIATLLPATTVGGALSITSGGDITLNGDVTSGGGQTYNGPVILGANANLISTNGVIDFGSTINGNGFGLSTNANSLNSTVFNGNISNVGALDVTGPANINASSISTLGTQTYTSTVTLGTSVDLSSASGNIEFDSTVNGSGFDLATHTTADPSATIFNANVINMNNLTVTGDSTINNAVQMNVAGTASFNDEFSGPGSLTITAASIVLSEVDSGVEPADIPLSTLTFNGPVTILSSANPTQLNASGLIHFANNVEGPGSLTIVAGNLQFDGGVGDITPLNVLDITAPVTFNGSSTFNANTQNFRGPVIVNGNTELDSSGSIHFFDTIDGPGSLTIDAALTQIDGVVGGTTPLSLLHIINAIVLDGANITANQIHLDGPATLGSGGATLISPDVEFLSTIMGPGALNIIGNLISAGDINIDSLSVSGTSLFIGGVDQTVTTVHGQNYGDTVTLNSNLSLINTGFGIINFGGGGVVGPAYDLTVFNYSNTFVNGITGTVDVKGLILGGTGGSNIFGTIGADGVSIYFLSIGSFCVNGSCIAMNLDIAQKLIIPYIPSFGLMACDINGCVDSLGIVWDVSELLKVSDPLEDVCVQMANKQVICIGGNEQ